MRTPAPRSPRPASGPAGALERLALTWLPLDRLLTGFWALFWSLNGLDKFFDGTPTADPNVPGKSLGWFGVNRGEKFLAYFHKLYLPSGLARAALYGFALVELCLGALFLVFLLRGRHMSPAARALPFKLSLLVFTLFSAGDILFGDRAELWEHGTFILLVLGSYHLYLGRATEEAALREALTATSGAAEDPPRVEAAR